MANLIKDVNSAGDVDKSRSKHQEEENISLWVKTQRIWDFTLEVLYKEMGAVLTHAYQFLYSLVNSNPHGLNPEKIHLTGSSNKRAKIVILLHGMKSGPYAFFPLASVLHQSGVRNVFTARLKQTTDNLVPSQAIATKILEIAEKSFDQGAKEVEVALIGHSLGALAASKYIWRHGHEVSNVTVNMMVSIAGRLRFIENRFHWFCKDLEMEIDLTFKEIQRDPDKVQLYTLSGSDDGIVPSESVHIHDDDSRQFVSEGVGHLGVIFSKEGLIKIAEWTHLWTRK